MSLDDFVRRLEQELRQRGAAFDPRRLRVYAEECWPLMDDNPDVSYWADRFLEAQRLLTQD